MKTLFGILMALACAASPLRAQGLVDDLYSIGAALGGQGACPVFISGVMPGSPAERAGLRGGDYLLAVDDTRVASPSQAAGLILSHSPTNVTLKLWRSGKEIESVVGRERRSSILANAGGRPTPAFALFLDAWQAEAERVLPFAGRVIDRVFSPIRYPDNSELFYPGFEIFVLRDPDQITGSRADSMQLEIERLGLVRTFRFTFEKASEVALQNGWRLEGGRLIPLWADQSDPLCFPSPRDAMFERTLAFPSKVTGGFIEAHWMEDGNRFWFAQGSSGNMTIFKYDPLQRTKVPLFDAKRLRNALTPFAGRELPGKGLPFDRFTFSPGEKAARFRFDGRDFVLDMASYKVQPVASETPEEEDRHAPRLLHKALLAGPPSAYETPSPDGRFYLGTAEDLSYFTSTKAGATGNLYLRSNADFRSEALTEDGTKDYGWDSDGAVWAPNSAYIAATKIDQRSVPLYPIVDWLRPAPEVKFVHLAYSGSGVPKPEYYVIHVASKKKVRIEAGEGAVFFRGWRSDSSELLITRKQSKQLDFMAVDPNSGATRLLFTERTKTFFDVGSLDLPHSPNFTLLSGNRHFLWLSERDGWNQIYLYDLDGLLIRKLTDDPRPVARVVAVDEKGGWVYYTAHGAEGRPYDFHLYRVRLQGGKTNRLTDATGQHDQSLYFSYLGWDKAEGIQISPSRQYFLDSYSDVDRPPHKLIYAAQMAS